MRLVHEAVICLCPHENSPNELPGQPQERLLEVVVRLRGNLEVLEVFLPVEGNRTSLHFTLLINGIRQN